MTPDKDWRFSVPINRVDAHRIVTEAGPAAKCVRFTVDGKTYTAVNARLVDCMPGDGPAGVVTADARVGRNAIIGVFIEHRILGDSPWKLYLGDVTGEVMDRVTVVVEVFE